MGEAALRAVFKGSPRPRPCLRSGVELACSARDQLVGDRADGPPSGHPVDVEIEGLIDGQGDSTTPGPGPR